MRLFIAVNFSPETLSALLAARERLRELCAGRGGFTQDTNLHLTLAFLAEVAPARVKPAVEAMEAAEGRALTLTIDRAGRFKRDGGDIWWAGIADNPALAAYQRRLTRELRERGFELENRRFTPHVTLARRITARLGEDVRLIDRPVTERIDGASLMLSELGHGAPKYTELARVAFSEDT